MNTTEHDVAAAGAFLSQVDPIRNPFRRALEQSVQPTETSKTLLAANAYSQAVTETSETQLRRGKESTF